MMDRVIFGALCFSLSLSWLGIFILMTRQPSFRWFISYFQSIIQIIFYNNFLSFKFGKSVIKFNNEDLTNNDFFLLVDFLNFL